MLNKHMLRNIDLLCKWQKPMHKFTNKSILFGLYQNWLHFNFKEEVWDYLNQSIQFQEDLNLDTDWGQQFCKILKQLHGFFNFLANQSKFVYVNLVMNFNL